VLAVGVSACALALAAALLFGTGLALPWRFGAVVLLVALVGPGVAELAGQRGRRIVGRDGAGRWWLRRGSGPAQDVRRVGRGLVLGPWVWLRFRGRSGSHSVVVDGRRAEPEGFRRLQVSMRLESEGPGGPTSDRDGPNC
jgi:hypothetical protein